MGSLGLYSVHELERVERRLCHVEQDQAHLLVPISHKIPNSLCRQGTQISPRDLEWLIMLLVQRKCIAQCGSDGLTNG